jgi:hypothetical protein
MAAPKDDLQSRQQIRPQGCEAQAALMRIGI